MTARKELWVLLAMFVLPIVLGTLTYYYVVDEGVSSTVNYGEFVQPIITTEQSDIDLEGENTLQGLWTLAYVDQSCDAACNTSIKNIKDTRILMNADMRRVQRIAIIADSSGPSEIDEGLISATITGDTVMARLKAYPQRSIFLIDPLGNIMLYYQPDSFDIKRVIKDLKRLFKYSRIG